MAWRGAPLPRHSRIRSAAELAPAAPATVPSALRPRRRMASANPPAPAASSSRTCFFLGRMPTSPCTAVRTSARRCSASRRVCSRRCSAARAAPVPRPLGSSQSLLVRLFGVDGGRRDVQRLRFARSASFCHQSRWSSTCRLTRRPGFPPAGAGAPALDEDQGHDREERQHDPGRGPRAAARWRAAATRKKISRPSIQKRRSQGGAEQAEGPAQVPPRGLEVLLSVAPISARRTSSSDSPSDRNRSIQPCIPPPPHGPQACTQRPDHRDVPPATRTARETNEASPATSSRTPTATFCSPRRISRFTEYA